LKVHIFVHVIKFKGVKFVGFWKVGAKRGEEEI